MEFKGTKGKWKLSHDNITIVCDDELPIVKQCGRVNSKDWDFNAKLIASAPEMFEQLKAMREAILSDDFVRMLAESQKTKELLTKITE